MTETATTKKELVTGAYLVLSIADLKRLLKTAKAHRNSNPVSAGWGDAHCIVLNNISVNAMTGGPQISSTDLMMDAVRQQRALTDAIRNSKKS